MVECVGIVTPVRVGFFLDLGDAMRDGFGAYFCDRGLEGGMWGEGAGSGFTISHDL